jgi:glucosyl-dolichyl phosphate glucuronosyltransferase
MNDAPLIVLLATHNGSGVLRRTLEGYARARSPETPWTMVVVDNGSTDDTPQILASFQDKLPLQVVHEPRPGKNLALNRALSMLKGDFYIVTDDDAVPEPDFLQVWADVSASHTHADLFGGSVTLLFESPPPDWLRSATPYFSELFALNQRTEGPISAVHIYGPNMAVRGKIFQAGYRFDESIGPNSSDRNYGMGSETEFCVRVERDAAAQAWFIPAAGVQHIVRDHQMTREFFAARAYRHGRGFAQQLVSEGRGYSISPAKEAAREALYRLMALLPSPRHRVAARWRSSWRKGFRDQLAKSP